MMFLGFSSMGQPELSLEGCERLAEEFSLDFLELRVLEGSLDLPAWFQSRGTPTPRIPVRVLSSSLRLAEASPADLEEFFRLAELAQRLRVPFIRVFGGGQEGDSLPPEKFRETAALGSVHELRLYENKLM